MYTWCLLIYFPIMQSKRDLITGLKTRTIAGRPNWDKVFKKISENKKESLKTSMAISEFD